VGAKAEIYALIDEAAKDGLAVLAASSELEELLWICHRIVVMAHGRIVADIPRERFSKELIMTAAAGTQSLGQQIQQPGSMQETHGTEEEEASA